MELFEYIDQMHQPYDIFYTDSVNSPLHWHYYSEILYMISGSVKVTCNNQERTLYKGEFCYFYPLQLHEVMAHENCSEEVRYAVIKFNIHTLHIPQAYMQKMYDCFVRRTAEEDVCMLLHADDTEGQISRLVTDIVLEYESQAPMYMLAVQSMLQELLIVVARKSGKLNRLPREKHRDAGLSFYHILEYIDQHSAEPLEVQTLAERCNMSYSNFARLFRENYGRSCKEYIRYIRLNKAQELLFYSDFDLDYIAQETGFFDCSHFIRTYKKWRGITPKQERMQNKETV